MLVSASFSKEEFKRLMEIIIIEDVELLANIFVTGYQELVSVTAKILKNQNINESEIMTLSFWLRKALELKQQHILIFERNTDLTNTQKQILLFKYERDKKDIQLLSHVLEYIEN